MRVEKVEKPKTQVITMEEDYKIPGIDIILEKGDKIEIPLEESHYADIEAIVFNSMHEAYQMKGVDYLLGELSSLFYSVANQASYQGDEEFRIVFNSLASAIQSGRI